MQEHESIDFIGIGAPRCGTTWLSACLREHPDVMLPGETLPPGKLPDDRPINIGKELDFFVGDRKRDIEFGAVPSPSKELSWYLTRFPAARAGAVRGEFSPSYMSEPGAAERIHAAFPKVKLIVSLRDPAVMLHSLYLLRKASIATAPDMTFDEAIDRGYFLERGMYHRHLSHYLTLFPREQLLILFHEDFRNDQEGTMRTVYRFLGVREDFSPPSLRKKVHPTYNVRSTTIQRAAKSILGGLRTLHLGAVADALSKSRALYGAYLSLNTEHGAHSTLSPETRRRLVAHHLEDITRLEELTGRDLSAWKRTENR